MRFESIELKIACALPARTVAITTMRHATATWFRGLNSILFPFELQKRFVGLSVQTSGEKLDCKLLKEKMLSCAVAEPRVASELRTSVLSFSLYFICQPATVCKREVGRDIQLMTLRTWQRCAWPINYSWLQHRYEQRPCAVRMDSTTACDQ